MSVESLRRRLMRLRTTTHDYRIGLADRLAAARAAHKARRVERVSQGLPAYLTREERIAELQAQLAATSKAGDKQKYVGGSKLGRRIFQARKRVLNHFLQGNLGQRPDLANN